LLANSNTCQDQNLLMALAVFALLLVPMFNGQVEGRGLDLEQKNRSWLAVCC
jgi:hypothetical protein